MMQEIIKISTQNGEKTASARDLYNFLEVRRDFATWCKKMFESYGFEQDKDFTPIWGKSTGGRPSIDYALTLDCAKEIAMIQRTEKGKQARQYFIECEKRLQKPMSTLDLLEMSIKQMRDQQQRVSLIEQDVQQIKAQTTTRPDYYTVAGYATLNKIHIGIRIASKVGIKAAAMCRRMNYPMDEIPDPRFGKVKMYPKFILDQVFETAVI